MRIPANRPCPCGSGLKYKYCCWRKRLAAKQEIRRAQEEQQVGGAKPAPRATAAILAAMSYARGARR